MRNLSRHLHLLILTATLLLGAISCGDEPSGKPHGNREDPTPVDTTHHSDTTGQHGSDTTGTHTNDSTTTPFTIVIESPRTYGYMGDTLQLTAITSAPAPVTWRSTRTAVATVNGDGTVTFNNALADDSTLLIATAREVSDTIVLTNRCWKVAAWKDDAWNAPAYLSVNRGDTISLTLVDSHGNVINDYGFNASACRWSASSRNADAGAITAVIGTPSAENGWQYRLAISGEAPTGSIITVIAQYRDAASALSCTIIP